MAVQSDEPITSTVISVGVRELKDHLSNYLRQVKSGQTIVITDHGREIAQLIPRNLSVREKIVAMRDAGLLEWSGEKFAPGEPVGETIGSQSLSDLVSELRE